MIGTIYFIGYILGSTYFPRLADIHGRRPFVIIGGFIQSLCTFALIFSNNFVLIYVNMLMIGIASPFLSSIGYNYLMELIPESMENPVNTALMCMDACGSLIGILYFTYLSKSMDTFFLIISTTGIISACFHFLTPESPLFITQGSEDNKKDLTEIDAEAEKRQNTSIWDFYTNKRLLVNIFVMACVWSTTSAGYYLINFNMKYVGGSVINNIYASVSSEIIASLVASVIFSYLGSKPSLILFFFISGVAGGIATFEFESPALITSIILLAKFGISAAYCVIYITTAKIFPTEYSATAFGICNIFARIITAFIPLIIEFPDPVPMYFLSITCFLV